VTNQITTQAVLVSQTSRRSGQMDLQLALFDVDGAPVTAGDLTTLDLTGYTIGTAGALDDSDTLLEALGKLEATTATKFGTQAAHQANSTAADLTAMKVDFNALLAKLQAAGLMA